MTPKSIMFASRLTEIAELPRRKASSTHSVHCNLAHEIVRRHNSVMSPSESSPSAILQTAFSFWSSKVLLTAVELGLFTRLANRRLTGAELGSELGLHPRAITDFFDALVAMKFLGREGDGPESKYFNTS